MISKFSIPYVLIIILLYSCGKLGNGDSAPAIMVIGEDSIKVRVIDYEPDLILIEDVVDLDKDGAFDYKANMLNVNGGILYELLSYKEFEVACDENDYPLALSRGDLLSDNLNWVLQSSNVLKVDSSSAHYGNFALDTEQYLGLRKTYDDDTINAYLKVLLYDRKLIVMEYVDQRYWW